MGYEILNVVECVDLGTDMRVGSEPGFLDSIRTNAGRALGCKLLQDAALYERLAPKDGEPFPVVRHSWRVGIQVDKGELEARSRDMDRARREGMAEAARLVRESAKAYDDPRVDGHCKHVLKYSLLAAAEKIEAASLKTSNRTQERRMEEMAKLEYAAETDVEAVAEAIEMVESHSSEHYARAAIAALEKRGWRPR